MSLTLSEAKTLVAAAQKVARDKVGKPITVVVVDSGGFPILIERMEGARPLTPSIGLAKAYTAAIMQRPCVMLKDWCNGQPEFFAQVSRMGHQPIVATDGGITIKRDGVLLGGLGISGGTGEEDEEICERALAECGYELTFGAWNPLHLDDGVRSFEHRLDANVGEAEVLALISRLNADPLVHGILVQLPLPRQVCADRVLDAIDPMKDVDGFHPVNVGRLSTGTGGLVPCTPLGCLILLDRVIEEFRGLKAVVIGKSNIVGKPIALLLLERECTVTVTHKETRNLASIVATADVVVAAAGSPRLVRGGWIKDGAVIIDVGINRITDPNGRNRIVGDVATDEMGHARAVTPVPNGVGPMTIACLLSNTVKAAQRLAG